MQTGLRAAAESANKIEKRKNDQVYGVLSMEEYLVMYGLGKWDGKDRARHLTSGKACDRTFTTGCYSTACGGISGPCTNADLH